MNPSKEPAGFTSLRILGKRAQALLTKAKAIQEKEEPKKRQSPGLPPRAVSPQILVRLSFRSVLQTTFTILAITIGTWVLFIIHDKLLEMVRNAVTK